MKIEVKLVSIGSPGNHQPALRVDNWTFTDSPEGPYVENFVRWEEKITLTSRPDGIFEGPGGLLVKLPERPTKMGWIRKGTAHVCVVPDDGYPEFQLIGRMQAGTF